MTFPHSHDPDYLDDVFGPDGILAKAKPGYVMREQQVKLARASAAAFEGRTNLLAEAPTGTGKSFAYLVPATWSAAKQGRRVVIVTANIALQEQLVNKDLPFLAEHLPWKFTYALAKGWSNYACLDALSEARNERLKGRHLPVLQDDKNLETAIEWADNSEAGDITELPFELNAELRPRVTVSKDDCLGKACDHFEQCFARKARAKLDTTQVIVANYHLFFADLSVKGTGGGGILPKYDLVVADEGHKAADIARDFFGQRITPHAIARAVGLLDAKGKRAEKFGLPARFDPDMRTMVTELADRLFVKLAQLRADEKRYKSRLDREGMFDPSELCAALVSAGHRLAVMQGYGGLTPEGRVFVGQHVDRCNVIARTLEAAAAIDDEEWIYYLDSIGRNGVALMGVPFTMRELLRSALFEKDEDEKLGVVVTSATLTTSTSDSAFDYIASQLGAETATELIVESPFNFARACLVVPRVCAPNEKGFADEVSEQLVQAVALAGGRTLALFTSYRVMEHAYKVLCAELEEPDDPRVMKQGDAPRTQLLQQFRDDERSVLLGCESFWEGVDVPGPALSLVFMDRIPFDHYLDPILDAVQTRDSKAFKNYQLPRATIMLRQGFGRLIRSVTDVGVVVCCDNRLIDKPYGKVMLRALPRDVQRVSRLESAANFLPTHTGNP